MSDQQVVQNAEPANPPWFTTARRPPAVLYFKINRRSYEQGNYFAQDQQNLDVFVHLQRVLPFGEIVETGTTRKRLWRLGNKQLEEATRVLTGEIGFETQALVEGTHYNDETESYEHAPGIQGSLHTSPGPVMSCEYPPLRLPDVR